MTALDRNREVIDVILDSLSTNSMNELFYKGGNFADQKDVFPDYKQWGDADDHNSYLKKNNFDLTPLELVNDHGGIEIYSNVRNDIRLIDICLDGCRIDKVFTYDFISFILFMRDFLPTIKLILESDINAWK